MTAEEVALEHFRAYAKSCRVLRRYMRLRPEDSSRVDPAYAEQRRTVRVLARIIRAIRAERAETERRLEALGNLAILRSKEHA